MPQSIKKEKINSSIKELTPTHSVKKSFKNIDIIGFDVLDENKNRLTSSKLKFYSENKFYIVLYGKRKRSEGKTPAENKLEKCKAMLEHQNGGYFWSKRTSYLLGEKEIEGTREAWQIGGTYKLQFAFKVPECALPGRYILKIIKEKSIHPNKGKLVTLNKIKIGIKNPKTRKSEKIEDYNLPLKGCLLNPAVHGTEYILFLWTGNVEFFIDKDIRNFKKILIIARGTPALGVFPLLKIYVDQAEIGNVYVNSEWNKYEFDLKLNKERHILKFRLDNNIPKRGMYINMIKLIR